MYIIKLIIALYHSFSFLITSHFTESAAFEALSFKHAISTPLTVLLASLDEIELVAEPDVFKRYKSAALTLKDLTSNFESVNVQSEHDVIDILKEVISVLESRNQHITILSDSDHSYVISATNAIRLKEAFTCLIKNAVESSQEALVPITISCCSNESNVFVTIQDFGTGIEYWKQLLITLPHITFKKQGSGIGLSFARQVIISELHGTLKINSKVGCGTLVECVIPKRQSTYTQILV